MARTVGRGTSQLLGRFRRRVAQTNVLDAYVRQAPTSQAVLDIFKGDWSSSMPSESGLAAVPGSARLFEDTRVMWFSDQIGGFTDKRVLEIGPLEAGHTYMLCRMDAREIIAVEANTRAYLKCLCVKEVLRLRQASFLLGDCIPYLEHCSDDFDAILASGILYHMVDPVRLLALAAPRAAHLLIWTHYYDDDAIESRGLQHKFEGLRAFTSQGITFEGTRQFYLDALDWSGFCGGSSQFSVWLTRQALLDILAQLGFTNVTIAHEDPHHQNGPALALVASK